MGKKNCRTKVQKSCGATKEIKHVVDLIKMMKKIMGPQKGQKNNK